MAVPSCWPAEQGVEASGATSFLRSWDAGPEGSLNTMGVMAGLAEL